MSQDVLVGPHLDTLAEFIDRYGGIDGEHHKAWVLDQLMRALMADRYEAWRAAREEAGRSWNSGIAP